MKRLLFFALTIVLTREVGAQTNGAEPTGRLDQIEAERLEKSEHLTAPPPATAPKPIALAERFLRYVPLSIVVQGLGPGAGPGISTAFEWNRDSDRVLPKVWGNVLLHAFYTAGTGVELRHFSTHDVMVAIEGSHSDAPQLEYYGEGPNSSIHNQTDFRREDTLFNFRVVLREQRHFQPACHVAELLVNVGPGTSDSLPTTESVFGPSEAPGIQTQSNFLIPGCSAELDLRDAPDNPHKGTYVNTNLNRYFAEGHDQFSFYRLSMTGEQYIPFFNRKRVVAIRGLTELSFHDSNQVVPFYLQPTLGSDTELRGYRRYRFYDENSLALTAEYRWEIFSAVDMALFADAGNVFHRPGDISLSDMKTSAGFGLRFKRQRNTAGRIDIGFSREGFQVWVKFVQLL